MEALARRQLKERVSIMKKVLIEAHSSVCDGHGQTRPTG
jgi:hypothetical protein